MPTRLWFLTPEISSSLASQASFSRLRGENSSHSSTRVVTKTRCTGWPNELIAVVFGFYVIPCVRVTIYELHKVLVFTLRISKRHWSAGYWERETTTAVTFHSPGPVVTYASSLSSLSSSPLHVSVVYTLLSLSPQHYLNLRQNPAYSVRPVRCVWNTSANSGTTRVSVHIFASCFTLPLYSSQSTMRLGTFSYDENWWLLSLHREYALYSTNEFT